MFQPTVCSWVSACEGEVIVSVWPREQRVLPRRHITTSDIRSQNCVQIRLLRWRSLCQQSDAHLINDSRYLSSPVDEAFFLFYLLTTHLAVIWRTIPLCPSLISCCFFLLPYEKITVIICLSEAFKLEWRIWISNAAGHTVHYYLLNTSKQ